MACNRWNDDWVARLYGELEADALRECEEHYRQKVIANHPDRYSMNDPQRLDAEEHAKQLADALERTHNQRVHDIEIRIEQQRMHLILPGVPDVAVERLAMKSKGDLFEQVFGLEVIIDDPS